MKWLTLSIKSILFIAGFILVSLFARSKTDKFTINAIHSNRSYNPQFETRALSTDEALEVKDALGKTYRYYGKGGQSFIFFSEDEKYVLKFFKQSVFKTSFYLDYIPSLFNRYKAKKRWKKADKLQRDFTSYKHAFNELSDLSGVVYIHLNPTKHLNQEVILIDKLGIYHRLFLDDVDFIIQRKAEFVYDRINNAMNAQQVYIAKESISEIVHLIVKRCQKGFRDRDPNIRTNCGFIGSQAIKIDVGRFVLNENMKTPKATIKDVKRITLPFKEWLKGMHPTLLPHLEEEVSKLQMSLEEGP